MSETETIWIEHELAETRKYVAEQRKLAAESEKLAAEAQKFQREHWWLPFTLLAGNTAIAALIGALVAKLL